MGHVVAERAMDDDQNENERADLEDREEGGIHLELLRFHEGVDEVREGGHGEHGGEGIEDDHSFDTPHAMTPTSANAAQMPRT
jgi:hypothetical protein